MRAQVTAGSVAVLVFFVAAHGCGWSLRDHQPEYPIHRRAPPVVYRLDLEASSVEYRGNNSPQYAEALEVREAIGGLLRARAWTVDRNGRPAAPARFRAVVEVSRSVWPLSWTILCLDAQVIGCPTGYADATASIELQVGTRVYVGSGTGTGYGGLYYNAFTGTPSAIEEALETAIYGLTLVGKIHQPRLPPNDSASHSGSPPPQPDAPGSNRPQSADGEDQ